MHTLNRLYKLLTLLIATVWLANGLFCKLLNLVPRHRLIVARILGAPHATLFTRAKAIARELGFPLGEAAAGGGSDGNFTAALGIPTLDGLGGVGEGAHAVNESILLAPLVPRTALLAKLLAL